MTSPVVLHVCACCLPADRAEELVQRLRQAIAAAQLPVLVAASDCLGPCYSPVVLALQGEGRASYVFVGVSLPDDLDDVTATCRTYLQSPGGWIVDARPCGRLRFCLRTRLPAPGGQGDESRDRPEGGSSGSR